MINKNVLELMINIVFSFPFLALATWRMSSLLAQEEGPFAIFERLRDLCGVEYDLEGNPFVRQEGSYLRYNLGGLLICTWCSSIWIGAFWAVMFLLVPKIAFIGTLPFALSAAAIFIQRKMND